MLQAVCWSQQAEARSRDVMIGIHTRGTVHLQCTWSYDPEAPIVNHDVIARSIMQRWESQAQEAIAGGGLVRVVLLSRSYQMLKSRNLASAVAQS